MLAGKNVQNCMLKERGGGGGATTVCDVGDGMVENGVFRFHFTLERRLRLANALVIFTDCEGIDWGEFVLDLGVFFGVNVRTPGFC